MNFFALFGLQIFFCFGIVFLIATSIFFNVTQKNSILLIIKQNPGIEYTALLSKISSAYSGLNSARAALSRTVKDLIAFGLVQRQEKRFFATEKGQAQINSEMKNKLLLKLNQTVFSKNAVQQIDSIIEQLSILIERGKNDADLLKAARGSTDFMISDLQIVAEQLDKRISQLNYLKEIFSRQIETLKQLDFNDAKMLPWNEKTIALLESLAQKSEPKELLFETASAQLLESVSIALGGKAKTNSIESSTEKMQQLLSALNAEAQKNLSLRATIYFSGLKVKVEPPNVFITASYSKLNELVE